jgi:hypothetical protein
VANFDSLEMSPRAFAPDDFRLEENDHGFRERVEAPMCQKMLFRGGGSHGMASPMIGE